MSALRQTTIYRVLHRPFLLLGGERELVMLTLMPFGIAAVSGSVASYVVALLVWVGLIGALRQMAKSDPLMSKVYLRAMKYQPYYPARSRASRIDKTEVRGC